MATAQTMDAEPAWCVRASDGQRWLLHLYVQPGARRTGVSGVHDGCLKLQVAAPPVEGRANEAVLRWLAEALDVPRSQLELVAGQSSRRKRVALSAPPQWELRELQHRLMGDGG